MCTTSAVFSSPRFDSLHLGRARVSQVLGLIIRIVMRANTRMNEKIIMNAAIKRTHKMIISVNLDDKPHNFPRRNKKVDCTTKQPLFKGLHENLFQRIDFTQVQKYCSICKFFVFSTYIGDIPYRVLSFMIVSIGFNHWFIKFCTLEL